MGGLDRLELAEPLLKEAYIGAKRELGAEHPHAMIFGKNLERVQAKVARAQTIAGAMGRKSKR